MKNPLKVALVAICMLFAGTFAKAQAKIGYINLNVLENQMPEAKTIKSQMEIYQKQFYDQINVMQAELQTKGQEFQKQSATMTDAVRTVKQTELQDLQKRIQDYGTNAQQQVDAKTNELAKPLIDKANAAISAVAKEKGYTYVFDSATVNLLVSPPGDDLMDAVKLKLALK